MKQPLATVEEALEILKEVVANPEKFAIIQSEVDLGSARMQTLDTPHDYNKVFISLTFLDKERIPSVVAPEHV